MSIKRGRSALSFFCYILLVSKNYKIIQISDLHLFKEKETLLNKANTYENLEKTVSYISSLKDKPDFVVVSGDLSQDYSIESYQHIKKLLDLMQIKYYFFPGNHDDFSNLNSVFSTDLKKDIADFTIGLEGWSFQIIDSTITPNVYGKFEKEQLDNLERKLSLEENNVVVMLHHHPIPVGSKWIDEMTIWKEDRERLNEIISSSKNVKAVLFGHVHHAFEKTVGDVVYASCPATAYQVKPFSDEFAVESLNPGLRVINLVNDKVTTESIILK